VEIARNERSSPNRKQASLRDSSSARIAARASSARVSPVPRKDPTPWMTSVHSTPITASRESSRRRLQTDRCCSQPAGVRTALRRSM
jgi:hypothetical protein